DVSDDGFLAQLLARLQTMQPFHQDETFAVLSHQDRALQPDLKDALGDLLRFLGIERRAPFHRHVDGGDRKRLALHHGGNPVFVCLLQSDPSPCSRRLITITCRPVIRETGSMEYRVHSGLMPVNFTTLPHFSVSSAIRLPKSESASTSPPRSTMRAFIRGSARAALISLLSLSITTTEVFLGAPMPYHKLASKPGKNSATVGMSGSASERVAVVSDSASGLPALSSSTEAGVLAK